ncbi:benzoate 4-monooxygenase cytochrome p450 [Macrophomina phaseolina]|uniref:Benzoate 4-monooxygenase cytochrome p450 n=1 Tax=Macrophomina phaseolina TaxID=35725 RepID=A0ABQ8FWC1_9PEZI|nr:benzoate 4-monooxygenase cytochrome p450 [Macrophomina phaseolina]
MALISWAASVPIIYLLVKVRRAHGLARELTTYTKQAIRETYFSPLREIPKASSVAPISRLLWAFPQEHLGNITLELPRLHEKLGPLIRIGPNEVSFYSLQVYDLVHKVRSEFVKDPRVYGEFVQDGHPALFSITDAEEHAKRRRLMGQLFNLSKMDNLTELMLEQVTCFVDALKQGRYQAVDLIPACRALEADIVSSFGFGTPVGALASWSRGEELAMVVKNDEKSTWMPILTSFPGLCLAWERLENLVYKATGWHTSFTQAMREFDSWSAAALSSNIAHEKQTLAMPNFIRAMVRSGLAPQSALSEAKEMLGPGTDTTSASLAHILWALAHNPQFQEELYSDLSKAGFPEHMSDLEGIPKLKACVKEGIRWAGAAAAMLPRVVPKDGVELCGKFIPGGTVLSSSPIWYLRDKIAFPSPEEYNPYRWLSPDGLSLSDGLPLRDKYYIPFSKGSNVCIGAHFSYYELFLSVSQLVRNFRIHLHPSSRPNCLLTSMSASSSRFQPVQLPPRREWVAAVPTQKLLVVLDERNDDGSG